MHSKLTLRLEQNLIKKAKLIAKKRGTSVSRIFGDFISDQEDELPEKALPPVTASMVGVIKREGLEIGEESYKKHLEEKYL